MTEQAKPEQLEQLSAEELFSRLSFMWDVRTKINYGRMLSTLDALPEIARFDTQHYLQMVAIAKVLVDKLAEKIILVGETTDENDSELRLAHALLRTFLMGVTAQQNADKQLGNSA